MLEALVPKLRCPTCKAPERTLQAHVFTEVVDDHLRDGVLVCDRCQAWYPIEDGLLDLIQRSMLEPQVISQFCARFASQLSSLGLAPMSNRDVAAKGGARTAEWEAQLKQRAHFDWWAENDRQNYTTYQNTPFWVAVDAAAYRTWLTRIEADSWLLDLGCADGRSAFSFIGRAMVAGFDISRVMVRKAIERARAAGVARRTTFFVADAHDPPLHDRSFRYVLTYGVLHHFPDPARTCREIQRVLKDGGMHFGSENNQTIFRKVFDLLMKIRPLWVEEAGTQPLISRAMIQDWTKGFAVGIKSSTSVFLPPHIFNMVGTPSAKRLLTTTDWLCSRVPGLRSQGGLLVFEITKNGTREASAP